MRFARCAGEAERGGARPGRSGFRPGYLPHGQILHTQVMALVTIGYVLQAHG